MTTGHNIMAWATALAALSIVGLLVGCSVEHRSDCTIYRFGPEPATRPADPSIGLPVVGPDRETALPAVQVCFLGAGAEKARSQ
jgi:hypothetical protein